MYTIISHILQMRKLRLRNGMKSSYVTASLVSGSSFIGIQVHSYFLLLGNISYLKHGTTYWLWM